MKLTIDRIEQGLRVICGIWACGLGLRFVYEFYKLGSEFEFLMIPIHPINIYFDFLPLGLSGLGVLVIFCWKRVNIALQANAIEQVREIQN